MQAASTLKYTKAKVVAEIGAVHVGSMDRAKNLIRLAILSGADYVKFQKRNPEESVPEELKHKPHPNARFAYGKTYLEHRKALELSIDKHRELRSYCDTNGIGYACSVWDVTSANEIANISPDYIKVPSACNLNKSIMDVLISKYSGDIHISTGMLDEDEKLKFQSWLKDLNISNRLVLYHCTSEYPCPFERLFLLELEKLKFYPVREIGLSQHGFGIASDIAAYMLGARWIERHFIDDRTFRHTDASASLEPDGLRRLCRDLVAVQKSLQYKTELSEEELEQRNKLRMT